ncbi:MAG: HAD hydrolase-like protein [Candidatus Woesearchaeota archaeon]
MLHESFLRLHRPQPIPFAVETVRLVRRMVRKVVSFSAHPESEVKKDLRDWGLYGYFDAVYGGVRKHLDADFGKMMKETNAKKETTLYVGDTTVDIELAKRNGVKCVTIVNPKYCYQDPQIVKAFLPPADFYIDDVSGIVGILKNSA